MGGQLTTGGGGGGGGGGGTGATLDDIATLLQRLIALWIKQFEAARSLPYIEFITQTGSTVNSLYSTNKLVRRAIIQNLSSIGNLTIYAGGSPGGKIVGGTVSQGIILNKAPASAQGGGTLTVSNIDLSAINFLFDAGASQSLAVYYEV